MIDVVVSAKVPQTDRVCQFSLRSIDGAALPAYAPGAHIDVHLPNGIIRQYSLCPSDNDNTYEIAVLLEENGRGGSEALHKQVKQGDTLTISLPKNHFPLVDNGQRYLLIAGGIGITPLLAMAQTLANQGKAFDLYFCSRSQQQTPFYQWLADAPWATAVHFHFTQQAAGKRLDFAAIVADPKAYDHLYICGPNAFMEDVLQQAQQSGWQASQLHREYFAVEQTTTGDEQLFEVEIRSSGEVFQVGKDESILSVLEEHDLFIPTACEEGVCGTCVTGLLAGEAEHRDVFLTDEEKQQMNKIAVCCSRAKSPRLVLDL